VSTPATLRATPPRGQRWPIGKAGSAAFWVKGSRVGGTAGVHAMHNRLVHIN